RGYEHESSDTARGGTLEARPDPHLGAAASRPRPAGSAPCGGSDRGDPGLRLGSTAGGPYLPGAATAGGGAAGRDPRRAGYCTLCRGPTCGAVLRAATTVPRPVRHIATVVEQLPPGAERHAWFPYSPAAMRGGLAGYKYAVSGQRHGPGQPGAADPP